MTTTVRYADRTISTIARIAKIGALAGITGIALSLAGVLDLDALFTLVVVTLFFAAVAIAYHRGTAVELQIGPEGIRKHQALGMGWQVEWPAIADLTVVPLKRPMLAVVSPALPARRGPTEWPIRNAGLPTNTHSLPATPEILEAVGRYYPRPIDRLPGH